MSRRILILIAALAVPLLLIAGPAVQAAVAQGSTVVITPTSGSPGSTVKASGANWTSGDHIQAEWGDNDSNLGSPVVVASDGTFTDSFAIPSSATQGSHQVLFWDEEGRYFEVANFDVTSGSPTPPPPSCPAPSVSFFAAAGPVGTTFLIAGSNWVPGGTVTSTLPYGSPGWFTGYQTPTVGANGGFSFKETVGTGPHGPTPPGTYTFTFVEKYGGCSLSYQQKFTVTAQPGHPSCIYNPWVAFSPGSGHAGTAFTVIGNGWAPGGTVTAVAPSGSGGWFTGYRTLIVNAHGGFSYRQKVGFGPGGPTPPGTYTFTYVEKYGGCSLSYQQKFTVTAKPRKISWAYQAGNYAGKSGTVSVQNYPEPNSLAYVNYCGPAASRVLISAWTKNVPSLSTLANEEHTIASGPNAGTLASNMPGSINTAIGTGYYSDEGSAGSQAILSNRIGYDILHGHPVITALMTGVTTGTGNQIWLNGWNYSGLRVAHIVTIYGFDFTSPTQGKIYYMETAGTVSGTDATGPQEMNYQDFWALVQANNVQIAGSSGA